LRRLLLTVRYIGTAYHGWQIQKNAVTVQSVLQDALAKTLDEEITVHGCSRTDAGVHALTYCLHFDTESQIPEKGIVMMLNRYLPDDIAALDCRAVPDDFHAQYSCKGKLYEYRIYTGSIRDPFRHSLCWHYPYKLDAQLMDRAARHIVGRKDFRAFCATGGNTEDTVRNVTHVSVRTEGDETVVSVAADGFLYNMVRIIVGTLVYVSQGKIAEDELPRIIESRDRTRAGITAPPCGLCLSKVFYEGCDGNG